jgi:hypothetical protein
MSRTTDWCRRRSSRAAATVVSPRISPQEVIGRLVVRIVEVLVQDHRGHPGAPGGRGGGDIQVG